MTSLIKVLIALTFLLTSSMQVLAQESDLGNWLIYFGNKKLNSKWNIHNEVQYRNYNWLGDMEQLLLRTGLGYNLTENNNNLLFGYGYILSQNYLYNTDEKLDVNEHRVFQQFITRQQIGKVSVQHRYRFEQRFIESNFRMRLRYFLALNIPLNKEIIENGTTYLSAYNEIFINTDDNLFDRDRLYGGLGYVVSKDLRFELGYMVQFFEGGSRDQLNVISFVTF